MIGDKEDDMKAGHSTGVRTILVQTGHEKSSPEPTMSHGIYQLQWLIFSQRDVFKNITI